MSDTIYIRDPKELTPVIEERSILFKRDDLFRPVDNRLNGGKTRQALLLIEKNIDKMGNGVVTGTSILSPQGPIIAGICQHYNIPCTIYYGGIKKDNKSDYYQLVKQYGATINTDLKSGFTAVLQHEIDNRVRVTNEFNIKYGMDLKDNLDIFVESTANQCENLPDELDNLVITCGSAITSIGVIFGLYLFKKKVKNLYLIGVAPNRRKKINEYLKMICDKFQVAENDLNTENIIYVDAWGEDTRYKYERTMNERHGSIEFNNRYEAKTYHWLKTHINYKREKTLMWIIGGPLK